MAQGYSLSNSVIVLLMTGIVIMSAGISHAKPSKSLNLRPVSFKALGGWQKDNHLAAYHTWLISCDKIIARAKYYRSSTKVRRGLLANCYKARRLGKNISVRQARAFFEKNFQPFEVKSYRERGLLTGYFEPELNGSLTKSARYHIPVYKKPRNLVPLIGRRAVQARRSGVSGVSWALKTRGGFVKFPTRKVIEQGYLKGRNLELIYLEDPVDCFYMHVQGSARIRLEGGGSMRIGFAGKNGYKFRSIGKRYLDKEWLRRYPKSAQRLFWRNPSFIFFRKIENITRGDGPIGAQGVPLTGARSIAVDKSFHNLGTPIWVVGTNTASKNGRKMRRLMIAQDVGSAIKGRERADIFWGSGDRAGTVAARTYLRSQFVVLLPKLS